MKEFYVGDKVKVYVTKTSNPFRGYLLTGRVACTDDDNTVGIEIDNGEQKGHNFPTRNSPINSDNGWWFYLGEVEHEQMEEQDKS